MQLHKLQQLLFSFFIPALRRQAMKAQVLDFQPAAAFVIICFVMHVKIIQRHSLGCRSTPILIFGIKKICKHRYFLHCH